MDAQEHLGHRLVVVNPALLRRGFEHGVFTADVVGGDGTVAEFLQGQNDIEVAQRRLDHQHVGTLGHVQFSLAQGFVAVGRIHLVRLLVAVLGRTLERVSKRPVVRTGVLGRVAQDSRVGVACSVKGVSDNAHTAVHHVGRTDAVKTGLGLNHCHVCQDGQGEVVHDLAFLHHPIVAVGTVGIHGHVAHQPRFGEAGLDGPGNAEVKVLLRQPVRSLGVFESVVHGGKQHKRRHPQLHGRFNLSQGVVLCHPIDARHGDNGLAAVRTVEHKQGIDQMIWRQVRFTHQPSHRSRPSVPARALWQIVRHQGFRALSSSTNPSNSARMAFCKAKWSASDNSSIESW